MKKFVAALMFVPMMAHAEFMNGNILLEKLRSASAVENMVALGYVQGVFDTTQHAIHCAPTSIIAGQINDLARQYLEQNPTIRNRTADMILSDLFKKTWPCANRNPGRGV